MKVCKSLIFFLISSFIFCEIINIKEIGVKGDGTDETEMVQKIFNEVKDGTGIYFPAGKYCIRAVKIEDKKGLKIFGDGSQSQIICAKKEEPTTHIFDFIDCDDLTIENLTFDTSGAEKFGGIGIYGGDRIRIINNRFTDPLLIESLAEKGPMTDRYALLAIGCRNFYFIGNIVENLQVEFNHIKSGFFLNNKIYNPIHMGFVTATTTRGTYLEDVIISNNIIENPLGYAIGAGYDPSYENIKIKNIIISNNIIKCRPRITTDNFGIFLGTRPGIKLRAKNCFWQNIQIVNNLIIYYPLNNLNSEFGGIMLSQPEGTDIYFENVVIKGNQILFNGKVDHKSKVVYKYSDGKLVAEYPFWREGFCGIYGYKIKNSLIEGNFIRGFPIGIHLKNIENLTIYNNVALNQIEFGYIIEISNGNNIFKENIFIGDIKDPIKVKDIKETDTIAQSIVKNTKIDNMFDYLLPWPLFEEKKEFQERMIGEIEMIGEIIDFLPSADCIIFKREDGQIMNLRISPWKRKYAARKGIKKCKIICEKILPSEEIRIKKIESLNSEIVK